MPTHAIVQFHIVVKHEQAEFGKFDPSDSEASEAEMKRVGFAVCNQLRRIGNRIQRD